MLMEAVDTLWLLAALNALGEPLAAMKACERLCNELIADLTGVKIESRPEEGMKNLSCTYVSE